MIARPLDLASRLSPPPRSADALFYVNVGLLLLGFSLCGSRFVLAPGLGVGFRLPQAPGALAGAAPTSATLSLLASGQILSGDGPVEPAELPEWLRQRAERAPHSALLVLASRDVPASDLLNLVGLAARAGFSRTVIAAQEPNGAEHESRGP